MFLINSPLEQFNVLYYLFTDNSSTIITNVHIFILYVFILFVLYFTFTKSLKSFNHVDLWVL